ncbi:Uncharacterised protein [uncultured archaeon]|nr:Uncharacterised protein [uncultured archaeon]
MDEKGQTKDSRNMHAIILAVLGIILVIIGEAIINIPHAPMRGSGLGPILFVTGVILLIIAVLRFMYKRK